jgi:hypothetical protein
MVCAAVLVWLISTLYLILLFAFYRPREARAAPLTRHHPRFSIQQKITTLLNSCCRPDVPDITIIETQLRSLALSPLLRERIILGFDGPVASSKWVHTKCNGECDDRKYKIYIDRVVELAKSLFDSVEYVVMPQRSCLRDTLRAIMDLSITEFVFVVQEDLPLVKHCPVAEIMAAITQDPEVDLVRLAVGTNEEHHSFTEEYCIKLGLEPPPTILMTKTHPGLFLTECIQFSDQNHITYKSFYERYVWPQTESGDFMEHQLMCSYAIAAIPSTLWFLGARNEGSYSGNLDGRNAKA